MAGMDFFIRPANAMTSADWIRIENADITVSIQRRITRTVTRGGEADDLDDEGAESAVYTIKGLINVDEYKRVMKMFRTGQPFIHDPFEERDVKTVFSSIKYEGSSEKFEFVLIEDLA